MFFMPQDDDPGERWADATLSDLRLLSLDVDVTQRVMLKLQAHRPAPAPRPLPGHWPGVAWAVSFALGCACLVLLMATLGAMVLGGDEGARAAWALITSTGQVAWGLLGRLALLCVALLNTALVLLRDTFMVLDALSPLVRGAGTLAAVAGILSIACSAYLFDRARRGAPIAAQHTNPIRGGLS
jgi:hypothetical protein